MPPSDDDEAIALFDFLVATGEWRIFWLVTQWIKKRELYKLAYITYYERWLYEQVDSWGKCDVFCYRVLNPMLEKHPHLFQKALQWSASSQTYVRRAAAVSLLQSTQSFRVNFPWQKVITIVERLKDDPELHVQKGIGWLLKYAYLSYPDRVRAYLRENADSLPRVTFRYALEKAPESVKSELMRL